MRERRPSLPSLSRREFVSGAALLVSATGLRLPVWAQPASGVPSSDLLLFGVDYYPDQTPESLWGEDARRIAEVGFTNVRIAEFAWALMEPTEGRFDFGWLHRAVDILHKNNIAVILGTPSAAPPPWLSARYQDIFEVNAQGQRLYPGGRRFTCPTNPTYRRLSLKIASEMAREFAEVPGIVGWQIDNEFTLGSSLRCYCNACQTGFQTWLRAKYHDLDTVNKTWGTVFWSQTYTDFTQIPVPLPSGGDPNPGLALDYDRYQSYANVSFQAEQLEMLRRVCSRHFITTNNVGLLDTIDMRDLYRDLDFVAFDNYPGFFEMLLHQQSAAPVPPDTISALSAMGHDLARGAKNGKPFMIMEEQSGKAGQRSFGPQPEKGQVRLWTYQAIAHGGMGVNYFRWDTATSGAEEYWHGMLNHDRSNSPAFDEMQQTVRELKALGPEMLYSKYVAETALVFDYDCSWALAIQPGHLSLSYMPQVQSWYGAISPSHSGIDIVGPLSDLTRYKIVFAPLQYVVSEAQAAKIRSFVQDGGVFVTSFRLGTKTDSSQIVRTPLPGLLRDVMGVTVEDYVPIYSAKQGVKFSGALAGSDATCGLWADILRPSAAEILGTYTAGVHAGKAAITVNKFGKGKAIYIGGDLDGVSLSRALPSLVASAGILKPMEVPRGVELTTRTAGGKRWIFLLNHTADPQSVDLAKDFTDVLTRQALSGKINLEAYGVRVLQA